RRAEPTLAEGRPPAARLRRSQKRPAAARTRRSPGRRRGLAWRARRFYPRVMADLGFTHVALVVKDLAASVQFYRTYAGMQVIHERVAESGWKVAWVTD